MGARGPVSQLKLPQKLRLVSDDTPDTTSANALMKPNAPQPPKDLPDAARPIWDELVAQLGEAGLIARVDGPALHLAILHYLAAIEASQDLLREGAVVMGGNGGPVRNPASVAFKSHTEAFLEIAKQMGLTFAARARTTLPEEAQDSLDRGNPFAARAAE